VGTGRVDWVGSGGFERNGRAGGQGLGQRSAPGEAKTRARRALRGRARAGTRRPRGATGGQAEARSKVHSRIHRQVSRLLMGARDGYCAGGEERVLAIAGGRARRERDAGTVAARKVLRA